MNQSTDRDIGGKPFLSLIASMHDRNSLKYTLTSEHPDVPITYETFGPVIFKQDPKLYFRQFKLRFAEAAKALALSKGGASENQALSALGYELFEELFPRAMCDLLIQLYLRVEILRIFSDVPYIPWELCKIPLRDPQRKIVDDGPFFCMNFQITRWYPGFKTAAQWFSLKQMALIGADKRNLPGVNQELKMLKALNQGERRVLEIGASWEELSQALTQGTYDAWHFSGHGLVRHDEPALQLDRGEIFGPDRIAGPIENLGMSSPLVFLNACYSAEATYGLTSIGGWAQKFIKAGAGAFIASQWAVSDGTARIFAESFYRHFLDGKTLGEASLLARREIEPCGDASFLSYVVFGEPGGRIDDRATNQEKLETMAELKERHQNGLSDWCQRHGLAWEDLVGFLTQTRKADSCWLKAMVHELSQGLFQDKPLNRLPGPDRFYSEWYTLASIRTNPQLQGVLVSLLCVVEEPVNLETLSAFAGLSRKTGVQLILDTWRPFMDDSAAEKGYFRITDPSMLLFLQDLAHHGKIPTFEESHRRIVAAITRG